jgi:plasmid stabilization system protein ParE
MRTLRLLSPAERELEQAMLYFEQQRPGLGLEFADEFDRAVAMILENPLRWPRSSDHAHRYRMHRFEFGIHYFVEPTEIVIAVVAHPSRDPASWSGRL